MTANNDPPYVASASTEAVTFEAYRAFDGTINYQNSWYTNSVTTGWLKIYLGTAQTACAYKITGPNLDTLAPKDWTFEGSNNDSDWTTLDTQTDISFASFFEEKSYTFSNSTAYSYYRLNITENNGNLYYLAVTELKIYAEAE